MNSNRALRTVGRIASRRVESGDTSRDWESLSVAIRGCMVDDVISEIVEEILELSAVDAGHGDLFHPESTTPRGSGDNVNESAAGLGDGKIVDQLIKFFNWLFSDDVINGLQKLIEMIIKLFAGL